MAVSAVAASTDPGETAVRFLEKVRHKNLNLDPGADTALSPQTSAAKRKEIARRLDRMARDLGSDPLEVGAVKLDGELAGVLVRKISGFDPNRMQVFPIALVKRGADWAVAPVPASFENSGIGYAAALRKRLHALEDWMLREQVLDLAKLRDQSAERMRRKIEDSLPLATFRSFDSRQAAERFLSACETRNLPEIHGLLGGLAANPPANWPLRIKAAESAVAPGPGSPWRLLVSGDVLRTIVLHEQDTKSAMVSIACLDPADGTRPDVKLVHLELTKSSDGLWRIDPPAYFLQGIENPDDDTDDTLDSDLLDAFPEKIRESHPAAPQASADDARQAVLSALHHGSLAALMPLIHLDGKPATGRASCIRAAQLWWYLHEPSTTRRAVPLGLHEQDETAAATFQFFSARYPDRFDFRILYFKKYGNGWLWVPLPGLKTVARFRDWADTQSARARDTWQSALLSDCPVLGQLPAAGAPGENPSRELAESWFAATREGDVTAALRLTTRLDLPDSNAKLLSNLGYELIAARRQQQPPAIMSIRSGNVWAAAGVLTDSGGKPFFPVLPIVATPSGPRILLEADLSVTGERSRDFLNKTTLERLKRFDPAAAEELENLFKQHQSEASDTERR